MERNRTFSPESIHIQGMLDRGIWCVLRATLIPTHVTRLKFKGVCVMEKAQESLRFRMEFAPVRIRGRARWTGFPANRGRWCPTFMIVSNSRGG